MSFQETSACYIFFVVRQTKERCKQHEQIINGLERELSEEDQYNMRLEGANVDKDSKLKTAMHQLSVCQERLDKQKKEEVNDGK